MKILGLDLGDVHTGVAVSDALGITCQPLETIPTARLDQELPKVLKDHQIKEVVVGYPKTMRGTESKQTEKIVEHCKELEKQYPQCTWTLWDERLTSKQANSIQRTNKKSKKPKDKLKIHSIAAALILESYLEYKKFHNTL